MGATEKDKADDTGHLVDRTLLETDSLLNKELPPNRSISISEKTQLTGLTMCYITLSLIGFVTIVLIAYFYIATNSLESVIGSPTTDTIQLYKDARSAITDDIVKIGDRFLGSILLPILTLLMGYMFGSREEKSRKEE